MDSSGNDYLIVNQIKVKGVKYLQIKDSSLNTFKTFKIDQRIKSVRNFEKQKTVSYKALDTFYKNTHLIKKYKPEHKTGSVVFRESLDYKKKIGTAQNYFKNIHYYKTTNESRLVYASQNRIRKYAMVYIEVKLIAYIDNYRYRAVGRSDFVSEIHRKKNYVDLLEQAIARALAPYGSSVDYDVISLEYVYYQRRSEFGGKWPRR